MDRQNIRRSPSARIRLHRIYVRMKTEQGEVQRSFKKGNIDRIFPRIQGVQNMDFEERRIDIARDIKFLEHENQKKSANSKKFMDFDTELKNCAQEQDENEVVIPLNDSGINIGLEKEEHPRELETENLHPTTRGQGRPKIIRSGLRGRSRKEYQMQSVALETPEFANIAEVQIKRCSSQS